jgi:hypothetical protein
LFGVIVLSETLFAAAAEKTPLQQATESSYRQMFALLDTLHYPYLFRCWNYMLTSTPTASGWSAIASSTRDGGFSCVRTRSGGECSTRLPGFDRWTRRRVIDRL